MPPKLRRSSGGMKGSRHGGPVADRDDLAGDLPGSLAGRPSSDAGLRACVLLFAPLPDGANAVDHDQITSPRDPGIQLKSIIQAVLSLRRQTPLLTLKHLLTWLPDRYKQSSSISSNSSDQGKVALNGQEAIHLSAGRIACPAGSWLETGTEAAGFEPYVRSSPANLTLALRTTEAIILGHDRIRTPSCGICLATSAAAINVLTERHNSDLSRQLHPRPVWFRSAQRVS